MKMMHLITLLSQRNQRNQNRQRKPEAMDCQMRLILLIQRYAIVFQCKSTVKHVTSLKMQLFYSELWGPCVIFSGLVFEAWVHSHDRQIMTDMFLFRFSNISFLVSSEICKS